VTIICDMQFGRLLHHKYRENPKSWEILPDYER